MNELSAKPEARDMKFAPTTPSPQPSYSAAGGLLLGLIVQGLIPSLSYDLSDEFALGFRLKLTCFLFPQTMVSFRLNLASFAYASVFGTS